LIDSAERAAPDSQKQPISSLSSFEHTDNFDSWNHGEEKVQDRWSLHQRHMIQEVGRTAMLGALDAARYTPTAD